MEEKKKYNNFIEAAFHKITIALGIGVALLILISFLSSNVLATPTYYPACQDSETIISPCSMITPTLLGCSDYNLTEVGSGYKLVEQGYMENLNDTSYFFNFSYTEGDYLITLCDGTTRQVKVEAVNMLWILYLVIAVATLLLVASFLSKELSFGMLAGFLLLVSGIYIVVNGIDGVVEDFLVNTLGWIVFGVGLLIVALLAYEYIKKVD